MTYKLIDGTRVRATRFGDETEFVTTNAQREVISTVRKSGRDAEELLNALFWADAVRFQRVYGGKSTI